MSWSAQVFAYCERGADAAFWAEPLNAITNAAFFFAALAGLMAWLAQPAARREGAALAFIAIVFAIAVGSFLFHTLATRWAALADTVPIGIFMVGYLGYALRRYVGLSWPLVVGGLAVFFLALWQSSVVRCSGGPCLNGSVAYFPAFAALLGIGGWLAWRGHPAGASLAAAGLIFAVSLTFRTLDRALCPYTIIIASRPSGTHFLWHLLNATLLYVLLRAAIRHGGAPAAAGRRPA